MFLFSQRAKENAVASVDLDVHAETLVLAVLIHAMSGMDVHVMELLKKSG